MAAHCLVQHPDPVAETHATMKLHHRWPLYSPSVAVGYSYRNSLLQGIDVFEIWKVSYRVQEALLHGTRVAEHVMNVIGQKLFNDGVTSGPIRHL
jgi:hypothetical protein